MKYNGIEFEAIIATPGCGKSYLCDKYPEKFVDVDELRLRHKYIVPENISREELERTKGDRKFPRRAHYNDVVLAVENKLDQFLKEGKILIAAPHPFVFDYFVKRKIKFCFVYPNKNMKEEILKRFVNRGNGKKFITDIDGAFYKFYEENCKENRSAVNYELGAGEYLEDLVKKFGCEL